MKKKRPLVFIIRDGWGYSNRKKGNAVYAAKTPNHDFYTKEYPTAILKASGNDVGNPKGAQGGSEVGHLTIGAGRIVWQPYERINKDIMSGSFFRNKALVNAIENCRRKNSNLHISGLFSDQGVHADIRHIFAVLRLAKKNGLKKEQVFVHLCLDGRDVPERSAFKFIKMFEKEAERVGIGRAASVFGRYYGMDRDKNWSRTKKAYDVMFKGKGFKAKSAEEAVKKAYKRGDRTDYYVQPTVIVGKDNAPLSIVKSRDSFIWCNFRSDRSRQITAMINLLGYCPRKYLPAKKAKPYFVCFSDCFKGYNYRLNIAYKDENIRNNLGNVISKHKIRQLRVAETEKYAHVTFFFNSEAEKPNKGEERIIVPSPKCKSYDMKPEMSAYNITKAVLKGIKKNKFGFVVINYANPDLVGHSGVFKAVVRACEVVDECIGKVVKEVLKKRGAVFLFADHGNAENMLYKNGKVCPAHGTNPVQFTLISDDLNLRKARLRKGRGLKDIAPTALQILGIKKPKEMTGESLVVR